MPHLPEHDRQALLDARHGDPFSVLGLHANGEGGFALRVGPKIQKSAYFSVTSRFGGIRRYWPG